MELVGKVLVDYPLRMSRSAVASHVERGSSVVLDNAGQRIDRLMTGPPPEVGEWSLNYRRETRLAQAEGPRRPSSITEPMRRRAPSMWSWTRTRRSDRLAQSRIVSIMIAHAIRADTKWFWHGPDR